ncbi:protein Niban-like isoform X2 [Gouania willdenowi]|uniref:protein Niban-like isoform X2 n=1 Tax=Gouania willdenowi TaxID=441366 RepID=UPI00105615B4|nr:protein Niban-like isoform X2 [Gouania willdenowi]
MGVSASSLLDDVKSQYIKGEAEAELQLFAPFYRKQFSLARFCQVEDDLGPRKQKVTQLLKQREALEDAAVLYEEGVFYFDDSRKWKERYVVVRANHSLECHDSLESFIKGVPPRHKLLPTGGAVLTSEDSYISMVDKCFPDDISVKEDFAPPLSGMPGHFPVYLRLPYRRDSYFCFRQQDKHNAFISILSDCIRHQNQDFLKKRTCEVQAFLRAVRLYREQRGKYHAWDMLIGSDVRVMANLVMEQLLPSLEKDLLPHLKAKKTEKKRVWFATVEAAYVLVQEHLLLGLSALKDECRASLRQQEVLMHSDMDRILECRERLEQKTRDRVSVVAEKLCNEEVWPHLGAVLEELMEPISSGFSEGRQMSEVAMKQLCEDVLQGASHEQLRKSLSVMERWDLLLCFQTIDALKEKLPRLPKTFSFPNVTSLIHGAQIDLQQLMDNVSFTFEQLVLKALQENPDDPEGAGAAVNKATHRVLKNFDYDSSSVRKRMFQEVLVAITLPFIKKKLDPVCKSLQDLEQLIEADHSSFIHMENIYENVLLQMLDKEVTKVVKEAASLKKYNLFTNSTRSSLVSQTDLGSPSLVFPVLSEAEIKLPSPQKLNRSLSSPQTDEDVSSKDVEVTNPQLELKDLAKTSAVVKEEMDVTTPLIKAEVTNNESKVKEHVQKDVISEQGVKEVPEKTDLVLLDSEVSETLVSLEQNVKEELKKTDSALSDPTIPPIEAEDPNIEPKVLDEVRTLEVGKEEAEVSLTDPTIPLTVMEVKSLNLEVQDNVQTKVKPCESEVQDQVLMNVKEKLKEIDVTVTDPMTSLIEVEGKNLEPKVLDLVETKESQVGVKAYSGETGIASSSDLTVNSSQEVRLVHVSERTPIGLSEDTTNEKLPGFTSAEPETVGAIDPSAQEQRQIPEVEVKPALGGEPPVEVQKQEDDVKVVKVSVESESPASDLESTDEVSTTSGILEDEARLSRSPVSADADDKVLCGVGGATVKKAAPTKVEEEAAVARAPDCVSEIRDLVMEVIEVEELVKHYPGGILKEE